MTIEVIQNALIAHNYPEKQAQSVAKELLTLSSQLLPHIESWIENGVEKDFSVEGFSIIELKKKFGMTYPAALLSVDWIIKEPKVAIRAISRGIR